ncbi:MAG: hypothetical protein V2J62_08225 [candidate division KSB1 bacterium]|jgi:hypothetical protein|nr:hypothetical protein [candidate division KSB1 bacterium]
MKLDDLVKNLSDYSVVLAPDMNSPEWWAGAPSACLSDDGGIYLAARMREGDSPRGMRGYELRILKSSDGQHFDAIHQIHREDAGLSGFERPALVKDPVSGMYRLYGCTATETGWAILKFRDEKDPADFDAKSAKIVLSATSINEPFIHIGGYKDPVLYHDGEEWHMYVIAYDALERIRHFSSQYGSSWRASSENPVMENNGWHNCYTRPAAILPVPAGYLFIYEGSNVNWRDPAYNIATGLAFSPDLNSVIDLTPHQPLLKSTTPGDYHTWRYSQWVYYKNKVFVYFEAARPNNSNELRVAVIDMP